MTRPTTTDEVSDLFGLPLDEFTSARDALAARLKKNGENDEAKRVKALRKPSVAAWVVNQLARNSTAELEQLFRLRAEIEAVSSATELRARTEERRKALTKLVSRARKTLTESGHAASATTVEKVSQTLLAADEGTEEDILSGTLERELVPATANFGAFGSFDAATVTFDEDEAGAPDPRVERLRAEADEAEDIAGRLETEANEAEAVAATARDRAAEARRRAVDARQKLERAEKR
jgi:hypothetical protein